MLDSSAETKAAGSQPCVFVRFSHFHSQPWLLFVRSLAVCKLAAESRQKTLRNSSVLVTSACLFSMSLILFSAGASHVIVTSFIFRDGVLDPERLKALVAAVGKERLVLDLSCRKRKPTTTTTAQDSKATQEQEYFVVVDKWQTFTSLKIEKATLQNLAEHCAEYVFVVVCLLSHVFVHRSRRFLVHGVDVEGKRQGVDLDLVSLLASLSPIPVTYAGGVRDLSDCENVLRVGNSKVNLSVGSALDLFGGSLAFATVVDWFRSRAPSPATTTTTESKQTAAPAPTTPAFAEQPFFPAVFLFDGRAVLPKTGASVTTAASAADIRVRFRNNMHVSACVCVFRSFVLSLLMLVRSFSSFPSRAKSTSTIWALTAPLPTPPSLRVCR